MQIEDLNNLYVYAELALYAALVLLVVCASMAVNAWANLKNAEADAIDFETEANWAHARDNIIRMDAASSIDLAERTVIRFELDEEA